LSEVSEKTGISLTTLQRYKKLHQDRLPAVGEGRRQRYPREAIPVFRQIRAENEARRGRESASPSAPKPRAAKTSRVASKGRDESLLTLLQVGQMTGISYPTLLRYVRLHLDRLPHEGTGRRRRYHREAVAVFQDLREQSRRGRRGVAGVRVESGASIEKRLERLEQGQRNLARQLRDLERTLKRPLRITLQR
jgi:predicted site-specific integrase-resolvase